MKKVELDIVGLSAGQSPGVYSLILGELDGSRKLPIIIGSFEAQSIAVVLEGVEIKKPLTHDLIFNILKETKAEVLELFIFKLEEGIFHAILKIKVGGEEKSLESRTSDGIAIAIRTNSPIYTTPAIMDIAGIELEELYDPFEEEEPEQPSSGNDDIMPGSKSFEEDLTRFSMHELEKMLQDFLKIEDYRNAALVRDEIDKRD